jgi:hypothetical protein
MQAIHLHQKAFSGKGKRLSGIKIMAMRIEYIGLSGKLVSKPMVSEAVQTPDGIWHGTTMFAGATTRGWVTQVN